MKVPKVTAILSVVLVSLTLLNFILKSYTFFVFIIKVPASAPPPIDHQAVDLSGDLPDIDAISHGIAQETGDEHHPQTLFVPLLTFIPSKSPVVTRPWVLVTSGFVHEGLVGFVASLLCVLFLGKYIENLWGSREYLQFVLLNVVGSNTLIYVLDRAYVLACDRAYIPPVCHGSMPVVMGLLVAVKQRISNHYVIFFKGNVRIKVTYIPFMVVSAAYVCSRFSDDMLVTYSHAVLAFVLSWSYIRFYKHGSNERQSYLLPFAINKRRLNRSAQGGSTQNTGAQLRQLQAGAAAAGAPDGDDILNTGGNLVGDRSVQFSLFTFFPYPLSLLVRAGTQAVFQTLVKYELIDAHAFAEYDDDELEELQSGAADSKNFISDQLHVVNNLQSGLFDLSPLKGAHQQVSTVSSANSTLRSAWDWISSKSKPIHGIKYNMDKRRKMALQEFE